MYSPTHCGQEFVRSTSAHPLARLPGVISRRGCLMSSIYPGVNVYKDAVKLILKWWIFRIYVSLQGVYLYIHMYIYIYVCQCMYIYMHVCIYVVNNDGYWDMHRIYVRCHNGSNDRMCPKHHLSCLTN
jgi:hypothetical protein